MAAAVMAKYAPHAVLVHPSNHPDIMAGQGTTIIEFFEQVRFRPVAGNLNRGGGGGGCQNN